MERVLELKSSGIKASTHEIIEAIQSAKLEEMETNVIIVYTKCETNELFDQICKALQLEALSTYNSKKTPKEVINENKIIDLQQLKKIMPITLYVEGSIGILTIKIKKNRYVL